MDKTVVGLFDRTDAAREAINELLRQGYALEHIGVITPRQVWSRANRERGRTITLGSGIGAMLGTLASSALTYVGRENLPLRRGLAGVLGVALGTLLGGLLAVLLSKPRVRVSPQGLFATALRRGGTLLAVGTPEERSDQAIRILYVHGAHDIDRSDRPLAHHVETWRAAGWERAAEIPGGTFAAVEEALVAGKQQVPAGVQRRPEDRPISPEELEAMEEWTMVITTTEEAPLVEKRTRVAGEEEVRKQVEETDETVRATVRRMGVDVEDLPG